MTAAKKLPIVFSCCYRWRCFLLEFLPLSNFFVREEGDQLYAERLAMGLQWETRIWNPWSSCHSNHLRNTFPSLLVLIGCVVNIMHRDHNNVIISWSPSTKNCACSGSKNQYASGRNGWAILRKIWGQYCSSPPDRTIGGSSWNYHMSSVDARKDRCYWWRGKTIYGERWIKMSKN